MDVFRISVLIIAISMMVGCNRAQKSEDQNSVSVSFALQKEITASSSDGPQAMAATLTLRHVVINVSGAGISTPFLYNWDGHDSVTIPDSFAVDNVPSGVGRTVQVLSVYQSTEGATEFFYGDTVADLSASINEVVVPIVRITEANSTISGNISGRYLTSDNDGPTGVIDILYQPPGKIPMLLSQSYMLSGWFNIFTLSGAPFTYKLADGRILFDQGSLSLDSPLFAPAEHRARVSIPVHKRFEGGDPSSNTTNPVYRVDEPNVHVWGFFGKAEFVANKKVCVARPSTANAALKKMFVNSTTTTPLTQVVGAPPAGLYQALPSVYLQGGVAMDSADCLGASANSILDGTSAPASGTLDYVNRQYVYSQLYDGNGGDYMSGFMLPFQRSLDFKVFRIKDANIEANFIEGSRALIDKVKIYSRPDSRDFYFRDNGIPCDEIAKGQHGFVYKGDATLSDKGISYPYSSSDFASDSVLVACPAVKGEFTKIGALIRMHEFIDSTSGGSGSGGVAGPPSQLGRFRMSAFPGHILTDSCEAVDVNIMDSNGFEAVSSEPVTFSWSTGTLDVYASLTTCNIGTTPDRLTSATIPVGQSHVQLYVRTAQSIGVSVNWSVSSVSPSSISAPPVMSMTVVSPSQRRIEVTGPDRILADVCYAYKIRSSDFTGYAMTAVSNEAISLQLQQMSGGTTPTTLAGATYASAACTTAISSVTLATGESEKTFYIKLPVGATSYDMFRATVSHPDSNVIAGAAHFSVGSGINQATGFYYYGNTTMGQGSCTLIRVEIENSSYTSVTFSSAKVITPSVTGVTGTFHANLGDCAGSVSGSTFSFPAGTDSAEFYFKPMTGTSGVLTVNVTGLTSFQTPMAFQLGL